MADEKAGDKLKQTSGSISSTPDSSRNPPAILLAFTVDTSTGHIVRIEHVDSAGARQELSVEEKARLAKDNGEALDGIIEQAFEAGIACLLGMDGDEKETPESKEEARLRRLLLQPLIEDSAAKKLIRRDFPPQAILGMLIQRGAETSGPASADRSP